MLWDCHGNPGGSAEELVGAATVKAKIDVAADGGAGFQPSSGQDRLVTTSAIVCEESIVYWARTLGCALFRADLSPRALCLSKAMRDPQCCRGGLPWDIVWRLFCLLRSMLVAFRLLVWDHAA